MEIGMEKEVELWCISSPVNVSEWSDMSTR
jgi:hypothetical protein